MAAPKGNKNAVGNKGGTGHPPLFKDEYVRQVQKLARLGLTDEEMARVFDVSLSTFENWKRDKVEFLDALKSGKDESDANVAERLYQRAMGYSHPAVKIVADAKTGMEHTVNYTEHYPPDTVAAIFWLKNRQRAKWRDRVDVANTHSYEEQSSEDLQARAIKLAQSMGLPQLNEYTPSDELKKIAE